jgi:alpha-tubulin suppressor-like RCC1 family protein
MKRFIPPVQRFRRCMAVPFLLLGAVLGCRDDQDEPTAPAETMSSPVAAVAAPPFRQVSAGEFHACGVTTDSLAYCWGLNDNGELGIGNKTGPEICEFDHPCSKRPLAVVGGLRFRSISAGTDLTCGITGSDRLYCWGGGYLGNGAVSTATSPIPIGGSRRFRQVAPGDFHTCALDTADQVFCWGYNAAGQLGDGTTSERLSPVRVQAGTLRFRRVTVGGVHSCAIATNGRAYCWGQGGQLGNRSTTNSPAPVPVSGGLSFKDIDGGHFYTCAVTPENQAYCWGQGPLGDNKDYPRRRPVAVLGGLDLRRVSAGAFHACGETSTNRAYCWGDNSFGALGDGTTTSRPTPVPVTGGLTFSQVSAGGFFTCGVRAGGAAFCWGNNRWGQLGDGTREDRLSPTRVQG